MASRTRISGRKRTSTRRLGKTPFSPVDLNEISPVNNYDLSKEVNYMINDIEQDLVGKYSRGLHSQNIVIDLGGLELPLCEGELARAERHFLYAVEQGDSATVKRMLDNPTAYNINVNCTDAIGRDALRIAIENEQIELLELLVSYPTVELKDSLLHAINEENLLAVEIILQTQSERSSKKNLKVSG
ncbi:unnamed protein product [Protopolystoma xenopodis]|uniref:Uncharacterized protein n=1 Tax=Protopolystoma xenopodis TaxID=117903 RepID=A0A448XJH3_9PLAT|nr:unnamed protein product [Protopolystoma xenopodis]